MYFCLSSPPHLEAERSVNVGAEAPGLFLLHLLRWYHIPMIQSNNDCCPIIINCYIYGGDSLLQEGARQRRDSLFLSCTRT